ncbi:choice-of-anchor A family protein [Gilvimarinus polysaccharolyticus]|uniref:choice-of-anchor A family protein n=1 Tax=Gilvimarinus polysaccharolyticus TaxID=863921 RepID=UPI000673494B|nr:choice-of-anchor A family protein [Gilvimarinus polysaccharolyticus]
MSSLAVAKRVLAFISSPRCYQTLFSARLYSLIYRISKHCVRLFIPFLLLSFLSACDNGKSAVNSSNPYQNSSQSSTSTASSSLAASSVSSSTPQENINLGPAEGYSAFILKDLTAISSNVGGRVAVGGNGNVKNFSVGEKLNPITAGDVLVVGGDLTLPSGRVYYGNVLVGGSSAGVGTSVRNKMEGALVDNAEVGIDFEQAGVYFRGLSQQISTAEPSSTVTYQEGGVHLHGDCESPLQVFRLDGAQLLAVHTLEISCIPEDAYLVFNISGEDIGLENLKMNDMVPHRSRTLYNFYEAERLTFKTIEIEGSILAPWAHISQSAGSVKGQIIAKSWGGTMQLHLPGFDNLGSAWGAPVIAEDFGVNTIAGRAVEATLKGSDQDGDLLTFVIVDAPQNGQLSGDLPNLTYTPNAGFLGVDTFTYLASDGESDSVLATVIITVKTTNDAPTANSANVTAVQGEAQAITLVGSDINGDTLSFSVVQESSHGSLSGTGGNLIYTPNVGFVGDDSFTFVSNDGLVDSAIATINITVTDGPKAPVITSMPTLHAATQTTYRYTVNATDPDAGDILTYSLTEAPSGMTVKATTGQILWDIGNLTERDYPVTVQVTDSTGLSDSQAFVISINRVNYAPVISSTPINEVKEGAPYSYQVIASDLNDDQLTYGLVQAPEGMSVDSQTGVISWVGSHEWVNSNLAPNKYCELPVSRQNQVPEAMDAVMLLDGSGSNTPFWPLVSDALAQLNAEVKLEGVGVGNSPNLFGVSGFGRPQKFGDDESLLTSISEVFNRTWGGRNAYGSEYANLALEETIEDYPFRSELPSNIIWVADEPAQGSPYTAANLQNNPEVLTNHQLAVQASGVAVHGIVYTLMECTNGDKFMGLNAKGHVYSLSPEGRLSTCEIDKTLEDIFDPLISSNFSYSKPYLETALMSGGSVWDWKFVNKGTDFEREMLFGALVRELFEGVTQQTGPFEQFDLVVESALVVEQESAKSLQVTVANRGLTESPESMEVHVLSVADDTLIASYTSTLALTSSSNQTLQIPLPEGELPDLLRVELIHSSDNECDQTNNNLLLPIAQIVVSDEFGASARQYVSVVSQDVNELPVPITEDDYLLAINQTTELKLEFSDADIGDAHFISASSALPFELDPLTGTIKITPPPETEGLWPLTVSVEDLVGEPQVFTVNLNVEGRYQTPTMELMPVTLPWERAVSGANNVIDLNLAFDPAAEIEYILLESPEGMSFDALTHQLHWDLSDSGELDYTRSNLVTLAVIDQFGYSQAFSFGVMYDTPNLPPVITTTPPTVADTNNRYSYSFKAEDSNLNDLISWAVESALIGFDLTVNGGFGKSGRLSAKTTPANLDSYEAGLPVYPHFSAAGADAPVLAAKRTLRNKNYIYGSQGQYLIGPMRDDNGNGTLDHDDDMLLVYQSYSPHVIKAYDLYSDTLAWQYQGVEFLSDYVSPAMADLDGAGESSLIYVDNEYRITAVDGYGNFKWQSRDAVSQHSYSGTGIVLSDLERDGKTDILFGDSVFNFDGSLKWRFFPSINLFDRAYSGAPHALDLNGDGQLEVAYLDQVRRQDGSLLWFIPGLEGLTIYDSYITSADITGNGLPELIVLSKTSFNSNVLNIVDAQGNLVKTLRGTKAPSNFGPLLIDDFLGDGTQSIFSAADVALYDLDGNVIWDNDLLTDYTQRRALVADLDQDGRRDILITGEGHKDLRLLSAINGGVTSAFPVRNARDGVSWGLLDPFGDQVGRIFVGDGAQAVELTTADGGPWKTEWVSLNHIDQRHGEFGVDQRWQYSGSQVGVHETSYPLRDITQLADLHISYPRGESRTNDGLIDLSVTITNVSQGGLPSGGVVALYRGEISTETLLAQQNLTAFSAFEQREIIFTGLEITELGDVVTAVVEPVVASEEMERNNNTASAYTAELTARDMSDETATQNFTLGFHDVAKSQSMTFYLPSQVTVGEPISVVGDISLIAKDTVIYAYLLDAPEGMTLDPVTYELNWTPKPSQLGRHSIQIGAYWNDVTPQISYTRSIDVVASSSNSTPIITTTPPAATSDTGAVSYRVQASDPDGDAITYELLDAPEGARIHPRTGYLQWIATVGAPSVASFTVKASDPYGESNEQVFPVDVTEVRTNLAPQFLTSPSVQGLVGELYRYEVAAVDPDGDVVSLSLGESPTAMTLNAGVVSWVPQPDQTGEQVYAVKADDGRGASVTQTVTVYVNNPLENQAPAITSVPVTQMQLGSTLGYSIVANDADGDALTYQLDQAPPGASILGNTLTFSPSQIGTFNFALSVTDGRGGRATQTFVVNVANQATGNQTPVWITAPAVGTKVGFTYQYAFAASDADGDTLSYSLLDAPEGMTLSGQTLSWTPTAEGNANVRLLVSDGSFTASQIWTVIVASADAPLTLAMNITPAFVDQGEMVSVQLVADGAVGTVQATLSVDGTPLTVNPNLTATVPASTLGLHLLEATVTDGVSSASAIGEFFVRDPNSTEDAPTVSFTFPDFDATVTEPIKIKGSVLGDDVSSWKLYYREKGTTSLIELNQGSEPVINGVVGQFDPTMLKNGQYQLVLRAWNTQGKEAVESLSLAVDGEMKVGHFSITFEDAHVPLAGIPIRVTRTYDSRQAQESLDFGYGWSVDYQNVRVHTSRTVGLGWQFQKEGSGLNTRFCVKPMGNPIISVRLPNGDLEKFKAKASPECTHFVPTIDVSLVMEPLDGTHSTLVQTDYGLLRAINDNLVDIGDITNAVDPKNYILTTQDGMRYVINRDFGLHAVKDTADNQLTFSDTGIVHSSGEQIFFDRDIQGRIVALELPNGKKVNYDYSIAGDLAAVANAEAEVMQFDYLSPKNPHYLTDIIDPRGITVARNEYDDDGRLVARIDANGNRIEFDHDIDAKTETITNRLGHETTYVYNKRGDVTAEINALGHTTHRTYDEFGNMLTERNPLGLTKSWTYDSRGLQISETDELGNTTYYTYNNRGDVTRIEEADGSTAAVASYDGRNWLTSMQDAAGNVSSLTYHPDGRVRSVSDAEGNETLQLYSVRGLTYEEEPDGTVKRYTLDSMGNRLSETETIVLDDGSTETIVTTYEYDAENRLIKTTDPLNNVSETEYDAAGLEVARIDALGRRTEFVYSDRGDLLQTLYADGTSEQSAYDAEGQRTQSTDRMGRTTQYEYDAIGQLVKTVYPDDTADTSDNPTTRTSYDRNGRVQNEYNERNHRQINFNYDYAGRVKYQIDPYSRYTHFTYNQKGWRTSVKDPKSNITSFDYDATGRLISTIHPDGTEDSVTYDALGRETSRTDQGGKTTQFEYTSAGLLSAVIDAHGNRTEYSYDSRGLKLSQADAENKVTRWTYDKLGREISRTLPEGQTETFRYDAVGNRTSHTDFNGDTQRYYYDINDRLTRAEFSDGRSHHFTYDAVGNRLSATQDDGEGNTRVTAYTFDARNRLIEERKPNGSVLAYEYDKAGNRTNITLTEPDNTQSEMDFAFDNGSRLSWAQTDDGRSYYYYDENGNLRQVRYPNSVATNYAYNALNRLTQVDINKSSTTLGAFTYTLDPTGRRTAIEELNGITHSYSFDDLYRLVSETQTATDTSTLHQASYAYDKVGNRTQQTVNGITTGYTYNANDWLLQAGGIHYAYDNNGNTLTETEDGSVIARYAYNSQNKMVEAVKGGITTTYSYNADGIRTRKTSNGIATHFTVDSNRDYAQVILENSANDKRYYHYGDDLISQYTAQDGYHYYGYDGLGSTRLLTDERGAETASYRYDAWGDLLGSTGDVENAYLFTGEQYDAGLDQYYLRARYYDQNVGRFTQMDTWMGRSQDPVTLHKYLYANTDPVNFTDPSGRFGIGGFSASSTIQGVLTTINVAGSVYDIFSLATSDEEMSARDIGTNVLLSLLPTKHVKRFFDKICKLNSFEGDSLVSTEDGLRPISEISIGDKVWSFDIQSDELKLEEVIHVIVGEGEKEMVDLIFDDGSKVVSTADHPYYSPSTETWVVAQNLKGGDYLYNINGDLIEIIESKAYTKYTKVYNLTVDNHHVYFVGALAVLNHNSSCFKLNSRLKENPRLAKEAQKAAKDQKIQRDLDDLTGKLSEGNLNPGIGTRPIGKGISEARSRDGARVYFRVIEGEIQILGKSGKANQDIVIDEILKTFK